MRPATIPPARWYFREDKPVYIGTRDQIRAYFQHEAKEFEDRKEQGPPGYTTPGAVLASAVDGIRQRPHGVTSAA